jgi:hypothetical protein
MLETPETFMLMAEMDPNNSILFKELRANGKWGSQYSIAYCLCTDINKSAPFYFSCIYYAVCYNIRTELKEPCLYDACYRRR